MTNKENNHPLVTIVILNWNGKEHLQECIDSVIKSLYSALEIILADNGSTDGSIEFVKSHFPSVIILENKENLGYAEGNNRGIGIAHGKYVVTLNNDVVVEPDWLDKPVEYLENDPQIGSISCRQMSYYNQGHYRRAFSLSFPGIDL
jgi:GT2 family glycosyltransferase